MKLAKEHGKYAVSDLVLEMSHFLDEELVNRVEVQLVSERLKKEWDLPASFQLLETRNKEVGLVL